MMPHIGLCIPCYMGSFEPEAGIATLELLERLGCSVGRMDARLLKRLSRPWEGSRHGHADL
jgi:hypothetical protein